MFFQTPKIFPTLARLWCHLPPPKPTRYTPPPSDPSIPTSAPPDPPILPRPQINCHRCRRIRLFHSQCRHICHFRHGPKSTATAAVISARSIPDAAGSATYAATPNQLPPTPCSPIRKPHYPNLPSHGLRGTLPLLSFIFHRHCRPRPCRTRVAVMPLKKLLKSRLASRGCECDTRATSMPSSSATLVATGSTPSSPPARPCTHKTLPCGVSAD